MNNDPDNLRNEDPSKNRREPRLREEERIEEKIEALVKKAENSKYSYATLKKVYDRGMGAYKTNPQSVRPNVTSPQQWALARVNSFIKSGHKQDDDLKEELSGAEKEKTEGLRERKFPRKTLSINMVRKKGERIYYANHHKDGQGKRRKFG